MQGGSKHVPLPEQPQVELVRCHTCHAAITPSVVRCPYCGQLTTGTERRISKLELDLQRRERLAERRGKNVCRLCNKPIAANHEICAACEAKDKRNRILLIAFFAVIVLLALWYFLKSV